MSFLFKTRLREKLGVKMADPGVNKNSKKGQMNPGLLSSAAKSSKYPFSLTNQGQRLGSWGDIVLQSLCITVTVIIFLCIHLSRTPLKNISGTKGTYVLSSCRSLTRVVHGVFSCWSSAAPREMVGLRRSLQIRGWEGSAFSANQRTKFYDRSIKSDFFSSCRIP